MIKAVVDRVINLGGGMLAGALAVVSQVLQPFTVAAFLVASTSGQAASLRVASLAPGSLLPAS